jgi:ribosomal protein S19E (S16A)
MSVLNKVSQKPGIAMNKILDEFPSDERDNIYPSLGQKIIAVFVGELELMGYVNVKDDKVMITDKGKKKLTDYVKSLTAAERKALKL